jgi:hypothetical protein
VDLIIALQPSMLSWNPPLTGKVGRVIEIYNPNPWMTFGGMGSKKLIGENIEYIANYDSHPEAQFNSEFRSLVKSEVAKLTADDTVATAQAAVKPDKIAPPHQSPDVRPAEKRLTHQQRDLTAKDIKIAQTEMPKLPKQPKPQQVTAEAPKQQQRQSTAFLDALLSSVHSGNLFDQRRLTTADMKDYAQRRLSIADVKDYAERAYPGSRTAELTTAASD